MPEFVVSARKYRPQTFDTVVGQKTITGTLRNAIKNDHLAQAFLFCGSRGVGKTTTARILAKTINCFNRTENIEACDTCESCLSFNSGASLNVYELDAASNNSVDDIRNLIDQVRVAPQLGSHKIFIIDETHMLSSSAFNAFLKTLEEPPKHVIFILATTEKHKIIPTILSRCQIFDFNRIKVQDIAEHLAGIATKEGVSADPEALHLIAMKADGALRDALSIFDQMVTFSGNNLTYKSTSENLNILDYEYYFKIIEAAEKEDIPQALLTFHDIIEKGFDGHNFIIGLADHYRNLLVCKDARTSGLLEVPETIQRKFEEQAKIVDSMAIMRALNVLSKADVQYKSSKNPRLLIEVSLMQLCSLKQEQEKKKFLTDRIEILPSPADSLRKSSVVKKTNEVSVKPEIKSTPALEQRILTAPTGNTSHNHISIKKVLEDHKSKEDRVAEKDLPRDFIVLDQFKMYWRQFAYQLKDNGMETFHHALIKRDPLVLSEELYAIVVDNQVQVDYIQPLLGDFIAFLRQKVNNYSLDIKLQITDKPDEKVKYLTGKDKFSAMARKNPNLHVLKSLFNLDIDF